MFKNYFLTALRNLQKNKLYSFINIAGLSVGITCCTLIFLYIQYERSFDKFNKNADRIYRLTEILHLPKEDNARAVSSPPMAPVLQSQLPEIQKTVRINFSARTVSIGESKFSNAKIIYADSTLFDIFTFPMLQGDPHTALINPYSIVLTETAAKKYFGNQPALGKMMKLSDTISLKVTGVMKDVPQNAHIHFDCVLSRTTITDMNHNIPETEFYSNNYYTYLLLPAKYPYHVLEPKVNKVVDQAMADERKGSGLWYTLKLQPLTDIHLKSDLHAEIESNGDISYVYIFSATALFILLIACTNFINLSTARSLNRSKEIGLRKTVGAMRSQLITQFFAESFLYAIVSGIFALGLLSLSLPAFRAFTHNPLSLDFYRNPALTITFTGIIFTVGFLAGIYPALLLSSFAPIKALKGKIRYGWQDIFLRKTLVVFQFTLAFVLIAGTGFVFEQLRFVQNKKLGMNKNQVLEIEIKNQDLQKATALVTELQKLKEVENITLTDFSFKQGISSVAMLPEGAGQNEVTSNHTISIDENFLPAFQIPVVAGRNFSKSFATDPAQGFMVNETAVRAFGWKTPDAAIGKNIDWGLGKKGKVVGVVKDFNYSSLHDQITPLILHIEPDFYGYVAMRVKPDGIQATISNLEKTWKTIATNSPFSYSFLDDDFAKLYESEQKMQTVLGVFTILSVFVSCLGLFGLVSFTVSQRLKEIGVRKVLGATSSGIAVLLSKDFLKLVLLAVVIGSPVAYMAAEKWLQHFAYRVSFPWWILFASWAGTLIIALATVSVQSIMAANANPVDSLRTE